jgi:hypothetical protein
MASGVTKYVKEKRYVMARMAFMMCNNLSMGLVSVVENA